MTTVTRLYSERFHDVVNEQIEVGVRQQSAVAVRVVTAENIG